MEYTPRMKASAAVARKAAAESIVLLKNDGVLPLAASSKIAVFGIGQIHTIKGGTGSGEVNNLKNTNVLDGLSEVFAVDGLAERAYRAWALEHPMKKQGMFGDRNQTNYNDELPIGQLDLEALAAANDAAVIVISRIAGEGADMEPIKGTLYLTDDEDAMVKAVCQAFPKTVLLLNTPGYMEIAEYVPGLTAIVFIGLPGQEGGSAVADVLSGKTAPSGKLTDTWPMTYADYPNCDTFSKLLPNGNKVVNRRLGEREQTNAPYHDDIYVGYRYFDTFGKEVLYPFGFGLHYGKPEITRCSVALDQATVTVTATVENADAAAREVVQVYVSAPDGRLEKPYQALVGYQKTGLLAPGASEEVTISFPASAMSSYDESKAAYVLEKGLYYIRVGTSSRDTMIGGAIEVAEEICVQQLKNRMGTTPEGFEKLSKKGVSPITYANEAQEKKYASSHAMRLSEREITTEVVSYDSAYVPGEAKPGMTLVDVAEGRGTCEDLAATMDLVDLCRLVCGQGMDYSGFEALLAEIQKDKKKSEDIFVLLGEDALKNMSEQTFAVPGEAGQSPDMWDKYAIPPLTLCDGPAGIRITRDIRKDDEIVAHQYCTAFPTGSLLACSFDPALLEEFGKAVGVEMNEYKVDLWLAPGMNIHRNPLCGRNFEYFSEDPVVSGLSAAAITKGVQKQGGGVTIKHFAGNEQEFMRAESCDIVSERAVREIYLKGFEIAVRTAKPKSVMTSYNDINGVPSADNYDLCTDILRNEWGFDGFVMTDWGGGISTPAISMCNGNDMIQPGGPKVIEGLLKDVQAGEPVTSKGASRIVVTPSRTDVEKSAANIMKVILRSECFRRNRS